MTELPPLKIKVGDIFYHMNLSSIIPQLKFNGFSTLAPNFESDFLNYRSTIMIY